MHVLAFNLTWRVLKPWDFGQSGQYQVAGAPGYDKGIGWESHLSITHRNNSYAANFISQFKSNELLVIYLVLLSMDSFFFLFYQVLFTFHYLQWCQQGRLPEYVVYVSWQCLCPGIVRNKSGSPIWRCWKSKFEWIIDYHLAFYPCIDYHKSLPQIY